MADVAPGIITLGLGGDNTSMILGEFHMGSLDVEIIIPPITGGGGGGGTTHGVFPDRTQQWDDDAKRSIIIRIKYKNKTTEKIFLVSEKRTKFIIKVMDIINITRSRIKITVTNLKHRTLSIVAKIKNIGNKNNNE